MRVNPKNPNLVMAMAEQPMLVDILSNIMVRVSSDG
jgi:hypothetical protein